LRTFRCPLWRSPSRTAPRATLPIPQASLDGFVSSVMRLRSEIADLARVKRQATLHLQESERASKARISVTWAALSNRVRSSVVLPSQ
jgi:hypothetical protein